MTHSMHDSLDELLFTPNPEAQAIWNNLIDEVLSFVSPIPREILRGAIATLLTEDYISIVVGDVILMGLINDYYPLISGYLWNQGLNLDLIFNPGEQGRADQEELWPIDINKGRRGHLRVV
jgi:hypothetical protein